MQASVPTIAPRVGLLADDVHVKTACAPLAYPNNIEVCPSTPVNAGSIKVTIRSGLPSTIDANETG